MRWEYNAKYRDLFDDNVHRDILIVPHQTNVLKNPGNKPVVTSKVPQMEPKPGQESKPKKKQELQPKKDGQGRYIYDEVPWTITNEDIVKEKFEYVNSINSGDNLTFSSCESAMFKVTIRNNKTYTYIGDGEEPDTPPDPSEDNSDWIWVPDVPNLQNYQIIDKETGKYLVGEVMAHAVVKLYMYFNGDSSTLIYMGMFIVEEDKITGNGYEREITAYDFLYSLREMDIIDWYTALFDGIDVNKNSYKENYLDDKPDVKKEEPCYKKEYGGRVPQKKWILKDALQDLFKNLCTCKPIPDLMKNIKSGMYVMGNKEKYQDTIDNEEYNKTSEYSGYGMPISLDSDLFDQNAKYSIPAEEFESELDISNADERYHERYGYMKILELPIYRNNKVIQSGSLSCGKFLEDIGALAGRYPVIRLDQIVDDNFKEYETDPSTGEQVPVKFNTYEKCILTFKPIQRDDYDISKIADSQFDNDEIVKGFKWDNHKVEEVKRMMIFKYSDKNKGFIKMSQNLTKEEHQLLKTAPESIKTLYITQNTFVSYLDVTDKNLKDPEKEESSDSSSSSSSSGNTKAGSSSSSSSSNDDKDDDKKPTKAEYQAVIDLFTTSKKEDSIIYPAYQNVIHRSYVPYEMTVVADPCREAGDKIKINFTDKVTGEFVTFESFILERKITGIQKMMDSYVAKGDSSNVSFSTYQASSTINGNGTPYQSLAGILPSSGSGTDEDADDSTGETRPVVQGFDMTIFCEVVRNMGVRFLDEPSNCEAYYSPGGTSGPSTETITYIEVDKDIGEWDGEYPTEGDKSTHGLAYSAEDPSTGSVLEYPVAKGDPIEMFYSRDDDCYYFYSLNGEWKKHEVSDKYDEGLIYDYPAVVKPDDLNEGDTDPNIEINGVPVTAQIGDYIVVYKNQIYDISGLDNFYTGHYYAIEAYYNPPGVWSTTSMGDAHYSEHRRLLYDGSGVIESVVPRYVIGENIGMEYDRQTEAYKCLYADTLTVNGYYSAKIEQYGDYLLKDWDVAIGYIDGNGELQKNEELYDYTYLYPGIWFNNSYNDYSTGIPYKTVQYITSGGGTSGPSVQLKWSDPPDITKYEPYPCAWEGTVIVRKEDSAPIHRWDGVKIVRSTTRDQYKTTAYEDTTIELNKVYYYGFFPYYTMIDDDDHPIRYYRFTKTLRVETTASLDNPTINSVELETVAANTKARSVKAKKKNNVTVEYTVPPLTTGNYTECKLLIKKDSIPDGPSDADKVVNIDPAETSVIVKKLNANSKYYFVVYVYTDTDLETESNYKDIDTVDEETEWNFDYTGTIQEWTVPETGIYSLETWGAQGGNVIINDEVAARGGYGSYSYGETYLEEGEKLYIVVGGQDGYNGGGIVYEEYHPANYDWFVDGVNKLYVDTQNFVANQSGISMWQEPYGAMSYADSDFSFVANSSERGFLGGDESGYLRENYRVSGMNNATNDYFYPTTPITIKITTQSDNSVVVDYGYYAARPLSSFLKGNGSFISSGDIFRMAWSSGKYCYYSSGTLFTPDQTTFSDLATAINYIWKYFANVTVIVDNYLWVKP